MVSYDIVEQIFFLLIPFKQHSHSSILELDPVCLTIECEQIDFTELQMHLHGLASRLAVVVIGHLCAKGDCCFFKVISTNYRKQTQSQSWAFYHCLIFYRVRNDGDFRLACQPSRIDQYTIKYLPCSIILQYLTPNRLYS